jgi:cytochrome P450
MMRLTLAIVAKTLFDADIEREAPEIGAALKTLIDDFPRLMNPYAELLRMLPLPWSRRLERAIARLDRTIYSIIEERRRSGEDRGDLLSMLMLALDEEGDRRGMSDKQVRDETMTLFLAGHETTANALAWTFSLLAQHRAVIDELHHEVDTLGGTPRAADYGRLAFTAQVLAEAMRLYPPAWAVSRLALQDLTIGGWSVPRGSVVLMAQAITHRDRRFWPNPERFDPHRFTAQAKAARPRFAYFPFGAGPRTCIGEGFAWMEGVLILATLAQKWRMELRSTPRPQASITLRPRGGIAMRLVRR